MKLTDMLLILFFSIVFLLMSKGASADDVQLKTDSTIPFSLVIVSSNVSIVMSPEKPTAAITDKDSSHSIKSEHFAVVGVVVISAYYIFQAWLSNGDKKDNPTNGVNHITFTLKGSTYVLIKCDEEPKMNLGRTLSFDSEETETGESYV